MRRLGPSPLCGPSGGGVFGGTNPAPNLMTRFLLRRKEVLVLVSVSVNPSESVGDGDGVGETDEQQLAESIKDGRAAKNPVSRASECDFKGRAAHAHFAHSVASC